MATKLKYIYRTVWGFLLTGLREYPDKIGGYHGCLPWRRSSSLKLQGKREKLAVITVAVNGAMAKSDRTLWIIREAEDESQT